MAGIEYTIEPEAERFAADVRSILKDYERAGAPIVSCHQKAVSEYKRLITQADIEYRERSKVLNQQFVARIRHAAKIRASKCAYPRDVNQAAEIIVSLMGGINGEIVDGGDPENAMRCLHREAKARAEAEHNRKMYEKTFYMPRSIVW